MLCINEWLHILFDIIFAGEECYHINLQAHYPAVDRDNVNAVMNDMVKAGRLQRVTQHPCLVRMGGVVRQLEADNQAMQAMSAQDTSAHSKDDDVQLIDDKVLATLHCCQSLICQTDLP